MKAESKTTSGPALLPGMVTLDGARVDLAYYAAAEIHMLARVLKREREHLGEIDFATLLSTTTTRIADLASIGLSALGNDENRETAEMHEVVHLEPLEASNV